jgi:CO/xanthine dehydrogenase Mo-binding subunit
VIGKSVPRKEGREKVTGRARYVDDLSLPGMLHGVTVRSPAARGRIRAIHFEGEIPWHEFTVVTAKDIPGKNCIALLIEDQPCLAAEFVNHPEEAIVLLAHHDKYLLEEARRAVRIEIEPLPAIFSIEDSLAHKEIIWGHDNIFKSFYVEKGDVDRAWAGADFVVEGVYETGAQEQLYIEPQGMIAQVTEAEGVTVWGSLQCPHYVHKALMILFGLPRERVRVVQAETGGGFGGKEEYPSMIAGHAALLARKSGWPVGLMKRFRRWCFRAGRFMRRGLTLVQTCAYAAGPSLRMRRHTERFADSARLRVCLRWSGIWIVWRRPWGLRRTNCGGGISFARVKRWRWGRS